MRSEACFLSCGGRRCGRDDSLKRDKEQKREQKRTKHFKVGHVWDNFKQGEALTSRVLPQSLS